MLQVMYKDLRKERVELLKDLVAKGVGVNPLPVLKQVIKYLFSISIRKEKLNKKQHCHCISASREINNVHVFDTCMIII